MAEAATGGGLMRWIGRGFAAGVVALVLLVAAYAIGYERGQDSAGGASPEPPVATETTETTDTTPPSSDPIALGEELWTSTGCGGCHSIDGSAGVGPTVQGLAGSRVELDDGQSVTADDAYLRLAITDPDAQIVAGFEAGVMSAATDPQGFDTRAEDVAALVAYMKAQR